MFIKPVDIRDLRQRLEAGLNGNSNEAVHQSYSAKSNHAGIVTEMSTRCTLLGWINFLQDSVAST